LTFGSLRYASLIMLNLPLALIGGIFGLLVTGLYLSVPAAVGFIALFGVAVLNGVVLVSQINQLRDQGLAVTEAVSQGCHRRLRPVLMTALVAILGLVPLLFASGPCSEVQRPLAVVVVVVSGLSTATLLTLVVLPVLYHYFIIFSARIGARSLEPLLVEPYPTGAGNQADYRQNYDAEARSVCGAGRYYQEIKGYPHEGQYRGLGRRVSSQADGSQEIISKEEHCGNQVGPEHQRPFFK
jgi:predicted RND superfamily exporter protein